MQEVVALPQEQQDDFAKILGQTQLAAIINATKVVVDRLTFLTSLDQLLFGEFKKTLLERRQLHRILVEELWIFGEQYSIGVDDESLRNLLKKHIRILERSDIVPAEGPVKDLDGKNRVLDLMLYRRYPQSTPNNYEHLVIELKRPDCTIGEKEIGQIENYAFSVERDERFDKNKTQWTFLLLGNVLNDYAQSKCDVSGKEFGHIHASKNGMLNIHVKQWATIIGQAKWRYEFFREKLEHQVSTDDSLVYLREKYHQYLPKTAATHKGPIVKEAEGLSADGAPQHGPAQRNA